MSRRSCTACILLAFLLAANAHAEWVNSLKPPGQPAGHIKLVKAGKPLGCIEIPAHPTPPETNAAAQLQLWLKGISGANLEIHTGKTRHSLISLRTDPSLGDEGYAVAVAHGRLVLSGGKTRGVLNAVYALLEEDLGCRFYTADSVRLPKTNNLVLAPVARRYLPQLKLRDPFYACAFDPVWSMRNRSNAPRAPVPEEQGGHIDYANMLVHTAEQIVPPGKYFKEHPEYFAQQADGTRTTAQLCPTHPDVAKIAIAYVRQVLRDNPHTEIVSVSKNDCQVQCLCDRCKKLREAEGSDMANQLFLVNQVAEAIEAEHPDVVIDTLAYLDTIQVPKTVRPRKNVAIRLCNDVVGAWSRPFTPAEQCDVARLVKAWSAVHNRIYIWDYSVNFSHYLAPMPNLDVMAANIRFWIKNHGEGVMLEAGYQGPAERDELKSWVATKLLWNPAWDEKALTRDFIEGHYGQAAPALEDYEELLARMKTEHGAELAAPPGGIRYPMDAPFLSESFLAQASAIFARAKALAGDDAELIRRVERAELPILYVKCVRGPKFVGDSYAQVVGEFERIARREKMQYLEEGGADFETKLAGYKAQIPTTSAGSPPANPGPAKSANPDAPRGPELAQQILADSTLRDVHRMAQDLLKTGLNAGSGYGEIWIRDLNTFIEVGLEVTPPPRIREALLTFFKFQGTNGDIVDGYIPREHSQAGYAYRTSVLATNFMAHKNTVETDQESSLVQAVRKYVSATRDQTILEERIQGITVRERLGHALNYVLTERFDPAHGLAWGGTTADWGDVQPESPWGVELDASSHRALDIYDNAMLVIALDDYLQLLGPNAPESARWETARDQLKSKIRQHLWDAQKRKFIPHVYLAGSPFPKDFDESAIYYHGGTAIAIEAGLLSREEVSVALEQMRANVRAAGAASIGLTIYPPYPEGFFKSPIMRSPYSYQNGGDWCWFGGRMIQQLVRQGYVAEAYAELKPMVARVQRAKGFYEWWSRDNQPRGSQDYRGSAGVLGRAIELLQAWAEKNRANP